MVTTTCLSSAGEADPLALINQVMVEYCLFAMVGGGTHAQRLERDGDVAPTTVEENLV